MQEGEEEEEEEEVSSMDSDQTTLLSEDEEQEEEEEEEEEKEHHKPPPPPPLQPTGFNENKLNHLHALVARFRSIKAQTKAWNILAQLEPFLQWDVKTKQIKVEKHPLITESNIMSFLRWEITPKASQPKTLPPPGYTKVKSLLKKLKSPHKKQTRARPSFTTKKAEEVKTSSPPTFSWKDITCLDEECKIKSTPISPKNG